MKGTFSNKVLFYDKDLRPGTVLLFDDVTLSEDMQEVLKSSTANFREPIVHRTLTRDRQLRLCTIPERCVWWLAKVEAVGDDQVMNRMLSVWIDDATGQDQAVLDHLKKVEAGVITATGEDPDVPVCQAIWEVLKGAVRRVRIPYGRRINFSAAHNRRNPAMLFDLIKCHARLHFCQRDHDEEGSLIASREDFAYARRLFLSISSNAGGQETKQTRNETAALETMVTMGLEMFTIKQLQEALGFSYHQTYRLLHGYSNSKATYTGVLDKCPAVSLIDATVAEEICGIALKRREHYFSFDHELYWEWVEKADVWIEETEGERKNDFDPDDFTPSTDLHPENRNTDATENAHIGAYSSKEVQYIEKCTGNKGSLHDTGGTHSMSGNNNGAVLGLCEPGRCVNEDVNSTSTLQSSVQDTDGDISRYTHGNKGNKPGTNVKNNRHQGTELPLPGILDHQTFRRSAVSLGHCSLCKEGAAMYHSKEQRASICEKCYARLVREWNRGEGVV